MIHFLTLNEQNVRHIDTEIFMSKQNKPFFFFLMLKSVHLVKWILAEIVIFVTNFVETVAVAFYWHGMKRLWYLQYLFQVLFRLCLLSSIRLKSTNSYYFSLFVDEKFRKTIDPRTLAMKNNDLRRQENKAKDNSLVYKVMTIRLDVFHTEWRPLSKYIIKKVQDVRRLFSFLSFSSPLLYFSFYFADCHYFASVTLTKPL